MSRPRRIAALRALANQTESPREAEIAAAKLRELELLAEHDKPESVWERMKRREAEAEQAQHLRDEARIAEIVRRWQQGAYAGVKMKVGAAI